MSEQNDTTAIILRPEMPLPCMALAGWIRGAPGGRYHSCDLATTAGKEAFAKLALGDRIPLEQVCGVPLAVTNVYMEPALDLDPETGEERRYVAIRMLTADGAVVSCGAASVANILATMAAVNGAPPWPHGLQLQFGIRRSGKKRWYVLETGKEGDA